MGTGKAREPGRSEGDREPEGQGSKGEVRGARGARGARIINSKRFRQLPYSSL